MKTYFKETVLLLIILTTFFACTEEEIDCIECIAAQQQYFDELQDKSCNTTVTGGARTKVVDKCPSGKASYIASTCQLGDVPTYSCN